MESNEISLHELKIYKSMSLEQWLTSKEVAKSSGVADRTARHHLLRLVKLGVLDQAEVFPAHRYRLSKFADKRNASYKIRLDQAAEVFGVD